jgi:hypothetical protein
MKKIQYAIFLLALGLFVFTSPLQAQYQNLTKNDSVNARQHTGQVEKITPAKKGKKKGSRIFFGGGIGGGYSTYSSYIQVTPIIGYGITPKLQIGSRITYMHQWYKDYNNVKYNYNIYGGSLFLRYIFWKSLYAQTEYEILSVPDYYSTDANANRAVHSLFAGLGFMQHVGGSAFLTVSVLYNFLDDMYSPYSNPLIRVGFGIGL